MTLKAYQNFIGIDIGKFEVAVAVHGREQVAVFENTLKGWKALHEALKASFKKALVVLETTGGHELGLILFLQQLKVPVHRANTRQVKSFIRSLGGYAKTDKLDALALARYGAERHTELRCFVLPKSAYERYELAQRRRDLKIMLVQEKNRLQAPGISEWIKAGIVQVVTLLNDHIKQVDAQLQALIDADPQLEARQKVLEGIEGIGPVTARDLICFMPELGTLNQKQAAALAGLAPYANDSGLFKGQRRIKGGRSEVRTALFMAAMAARNSHSRFKTFYECLIGRGKKPMVALTALMRKLIIVANARVKEWLLAQPSGSVMT